MASRDEYVEKLKQTIDELNELEKSVLVERHLISKELTQATGGAGVVVNNDQSQVIMVNEEDHLRIQVLRSGYNLTEIWNIIDRIDSEIEKCLDYYRPYMEKTKSI